MKVLFAVNDEKDAEAITRFYQKEYKEIISSKTVFYFNAIIKELQKDKTYDRIVISEDLELIANDNYQAVDKFIFDKMDNISDEATNVEGNDIPIILLGMDRRTKNDPLLLKLFGLGLYNVLVGQDRSIQKVCNLIYRPRTKKEAKAYYNVEAENVSYNTESKSVVSENEIQNILNHYQRIGSNIPKCVQSFDSIVSQYSKEQIKLIIDVLPNKVKVILEENSDAYRKIMGIKGKKTAGTSQLRKTEYIEKEINSGNKLTKPVIIPSAVGSKSVTKMKKQINQDEIKAKEKGNEKSAQLETRKKEKQRLAMEKSKAEEENRKKEEEKMAKEKAEAEAKKKEQERIAKEKAKAEAEAKRKEEERIAKEKAKAEAEAKRKEEERIAKEKAKAEAEAKRKEEERIAKAEAEAKRKEEEKIAKEKAKAEAEAKRKEEERIAKAEAEAKKKEEERIAKEKAKAEAEAKRKEEERIAKAEAEAKKKEQERIAKEKAKAEAEAKRKEEERIAKAKAEAKKKEEERIAKEKAKAEAEAKRKEQERIAKAEAEAKKKEEERIAREKAKAEAEAKKKEEERIAQEKAKAEANNIDSDQTEKKRRGRPRKNAENEETDLEDVPVKKRRGRPRKNVEDEEDIEDKVLFNDENLLEYDENKEDNEKKLLEIKDKENEEENDDLLDFDEENNEDVLDLYEDEEEEDNDDLLDLDEDEEEEEDNDDLLDFDEDEEEEEDNDDLLDFDEDEEEEEDNDDLLDFDEDEEEEEDNDDLLDLDEDEEEEEDNDDLLDFDEDEEEEEDNDDLLDFDEDEEEEEDNNDLLDFDEDEEEEEDNNDLLDFDENEEEEENNDDLPDFDENEEEEEDNNDLLDFDEDEEKEEDNDDLLDFDEDEEKEEDNDDLLGFDDDEEDEDEVMDLEDNTETQDENSKIQEETDKQYNGSFKGISNKNYQYDSNLANNIKDLKETDDNNAYNIDTDDLITADQKIVAFVGTTKNGTSFIVNNLADLFANRGIKTAILDLTKNKNSYYIYTNNEEELREKAHNCFEKLTAGVAEGVDVNKNLTIFTSLPGEDDSSNDVNSIIKTLLQNYKIVLLDCDFDTDVRYFKVAQEIYLVQSLDVLTIQPLTAFLRDLKVKNILDANKLRIIINKNLRVNTLNEKLLIGGMSVYNDPAMTYMTDLFDRDRIKYATIPFEEQVYARYLDGLVNCEISSKGYSKNFISYLNKLGDMVYPTINDKKSKKSYNDYSKNSKQYENAFSKDTSSTLDKMKKKY